MSTGETSSTEVGRETKNMDSTRIESQMKEVWDSCSHPLGVFLASTSRLRVGAWLQSWFLWVANHLRICLQRCKKEFINFYIIFINFLIKKWTVAYSVFICNYFCFVLEQKVILEAAQVATLEPCTAVSLVCSHLSEWLLNEFRTQGKPLENLVNLDEFSEGRLHCQTTSKWCTTN